MISRLSLVLTVAGLIGGCASLPPSSPHNRDDMHDFQLEARFALRSSLPGQPVQSSGGRMTWTHRDAGDHILLASPLGYGLAEIDVTPGYSRLRTADGKESASTDPDAMIEEATGLRLPVTQLPAWLLGRAGNDAELETDTAGRPTKLRESGWQVEYLYDSDRASALPARLNISLPGEIDLKLRIEDWRIAP